MRQPRIARIVRHARVRIRFPFLKGGELFLHSTNPLYALKYPGTIGLKTGFTDPAGHCLIAIVRRGSRTLGAVLLNSRTPGARPSRCSTPALRCRPAPANCLPGTPRSRSRRRRPRSSRRRRCPRRRRSRSGPRCRRARRSCRCPARPAGHPRRRLPASVSLPAPPCARVVSGTAVRRSLPAPLGGRAQAAVRAVVPAAAEQAVVGRAASGRSFRRAEEPIVVRRPMSRPRAGSRHRVRSPAAEEVVGAAPAADHVGVGGARAACRAVRCPAVDCA